MNTLYKQVGQRLKIARQAAGFKTARAFALSYNIAQSTYSQYETGKRKFSVDVLIQYSEYLNINPNWLLFGKLPMFDIPDIKTTPSIDILWNAKPKREVREPLPRYM